MGILNAIFAPFIVLYLLMYSFFRYFEVCLFDASIVDIIDILVFRSTIRILHLLEDVVIPYSLSGNSESSTNSHIYSQEDWTRAIRRLACI